MSYKCQFASVAPVDADKLPEVEHVCVMNHGGFVMDFQAKDVHTHNSVGSGSYSVNQKQCVDLGDAGPEGSEFKVAVNAHAGNKENANRHVTYTKNGLSALFQCKGSTLNYYCKLLVDPKYTVPKVDTVCVNNRGAYAMSFDAKDLRTGNYHGTTGNFPNPQSECFDLADTKDVKTGDLFEIDAKAVAGREALADSRVEYKAGGGTATYQCGGSTLGIHCELLRDADIASNVVVI